MNKIALKIFRWILRIISGLLILFSLFMFIGEVFFEPGGGIGRLSGSDIFQLSIFAVVLAGLGLAWKWELTGGIVALIAFGLLGIINPNVMKAGLMLVYPLTAVLFLILWVMARKPDMEQV